MAMVRDLKNGLDVEWWPTGRPKPYAKNARKIPREAIDKVALSIREFGWRQPLVCDEHDVILAGHARLLAAQQLGLELVPVHVAAGLTEEQCRAYRLMDNRSHQETTWDMDLLTPELLDLSVIGVDLKLTGFDEAEWPLLAVGSDQSGQLDCNFQILIDCTSEQQQSQLLGRFQEQGITCRALIS